ncbi:MAG: hypothetical protein ABIY52_02365 [Gemmatimonadaceae bacterium]
MSHDGVVADALSVLLRAQGQPLAAVQRSFHELRTRHHDVGLELLWENGRYAGASNYDALITTPNGTISLGYAASHAVPWLLRSACHSHECDVATVNSRLIDIQTVVAYLDLVWNDTRLMEQMVDDQLIDEAVESLAIEPTREDISAAVDEFRIARGLNRAADFTQWLSDRGLGHERLEWIVSRDSAARALRRHVVTAEMVRERMSSDFDTVRIARFRSDEEHVGDFYAAAEQHFPDRLFASLVRRDLGAAQAAMIFGAPPGTTLTRVPSGDGFDVVHVISFAPAQPDDVERVIFREWLAERRKSARVEWFWGNATAPS